MTPIERKRVGLLDKVRGPPFSWILQRKVVVAASNKELKKVREREKSVVGRHKNRGFREATRCFE